MKTQMVVVTFRIMFIAIIFITHSKVHSEDYIYNEKWEIGYVNSYGSQVFTTVNNSSMWRFPNNLPCYLGPDPQHDDVKRNRFERSIFCNGSKLGTLVCEANDDSTKCSKKISDYILIVDIERYLTMKMRRKKALEFERDNKTPY